MKREELSTADLARAPEEVRGRHDQHVVGREPVREPPAPTPRRSEDAMAAPPESFSRGPKAPVSHGSAERAPLFPDREAEQLRARWNEVQTGFVDEPRRAVETADSLVAEVMKRLAESFAGERQSLERQWDRGTEVTTEDLRVVLQRYRSFFDRLLSV